MVLIPSILAMIVALGIGVGLPIAGNLSRRS